MKTPAASAAAAPVHERDYAVAAEVLYLLNLLLLPGLAFALLLLLAYRERASTNPLTRCHIRQALVVSIKGGLLLVLVAATIVFVGGLDDPVTWVLLVLYVLCFHATLVMLGVLGLSRAITSQTYVYPLLGSRAW